jgi:hypothetical protein
MAREIDSISNKECYCEKITFRPCPFCQRSNIWTRLSSDEKSKAIAYKRILVANKQPSKLMLDYINLIHKRYPDFDIGVIP